VVCPLSRLLRVRVYDAAMENLNGKVAVVTGGASGIGLALAEEFIEAGMKVVLADLDEPRLRDVESRLSESGAEVTSVVCNTTREEDVYALAQTTLERYGAAHVLCNNAGIAGIGDAWNDPIELWARVLDVNVMGVVHGIRAFMPIMADQGEGHIVNTASVAGLGPVPGAAPYAASKHAVVGLSESLFMELEIAGSPVGISVLCPAFVRTRLMEHEPTEVGPGFAAATNQLLRNGIDGGIDPSEVSRQVIDAIRARRFWILTHPETRPRAVERVQRAAHGENPRFAMPLPATD
jgi:NAD(P)-dependent dehydrogenase (short-subunit alcohol dehydrogenase family)